MVIEQPRYKVIRKDGKFEIREYESYILAQVEIESNWSSALNSGFRILADYIFGNNKRKARIAMTAPVTEQAARQSEKIAMTAPVTSTMLGEQKHRISFTMPGKYTMETLPEPNSQDISFTRVERHKTAVIRFSGYMNEGLAKKRSEELRQWLKDNAIEATSGFVYAQYNPPWIPGVFRRNEIIVDIA